MNMFSLGDLVVPLKGSEKHRSTVLVIVHIEQDYVQVMKPDGRLGWYHESDIAVIE